LKSLRIIRRRFNKDKLIYSKFELIKEWLFYIRLNNKESELKYIITA